MNKSMAIALCAAAMATLAHADATTWRWVGGSDDSWENADNWEVTDENGNPATAVSPGANWSGDVILDGDFTVTYASGDLAFTGTLTIMNGAVFHQESGSWPNFPNGTLILNNGLFDLPNISNANSLGTIIFNEGGSVNLPPGLGSAVSIVINDGGSVTVAGNIDNSKLVLNDGAAFTSTSGDFNISSDTTFGAVTLTVYTITTNPGTPGDARSKISLYGTKLTATRTGATYGIWDAHYSGAINFLPGRDSSYTFPADSITDKASAYNLLFASGLFTFDGQTLVSDSNVWTDHFSVNVEDSMATVAYTEVLAANRIGDLSENDVTSSSATVSATIPEIEQDAIVKFAYGAAVPSDADLLAGETVPVVNGVALKVLTGLDANASYHYAFAIVVGDEIATSKSSAFVASDYDFVYDNGWVGGRSPANLAGGTESALFLSDFTTAGEFSLTNKRIQDSVFTSSTMLFGTADVANSALVNTRSHALNQTPYGIYAAAYALNFISASGSGIFRRACSYTFRAIDTQMEAFFTENIGNGKIRVSGETLSAADYASLMSLETIGTETGSYDYGDGEGPVEKSVAVATLTLWDVLHASDTGDWTLKDGARVRLAGKARIGALSIEPGADAKIDLNGNALVVSSLTLNGENLKGTFTSATLPALLLGEGTLSVGRAPTLIMVH